MIVRHCTLSGGQWRWIRVREYAPGRQHRGAPKVGAVIVLRHEIDKNSVSFVEAGINMEEQIMCAEQCTFYMSSVAFLGPQYAPEFWLLWSFATDPTVGAYSAPQNS